MKFAGISYRVQPGHSDEIAEIFSPASFRRASSPIIRDAHRREIGRIIGTGLFIQGNRMMRLIQYAGELDDVARHMAGQEGVHEAERRLARYLEMPRDTTTVEGFLRYFTKSTMRCLDQRVYQEAFVEQLVAFRTDLRPGAEDELAAAVADGRLDIPPGRPDDAARILATATFVQDNVLVRVLQFEGAEEGLTALVANDGGIVRERELAGFTDGRPAIQTHQDVVDVLAGSRMRCISLLSVASVLARPRAAS